LRKDIWPLPRTLQEKVYGHVDALQKTIRFVAEIEIPVLKAYEKKKKSFGYIIACIIQIHDHDGLCIINKDIDPERTKDVCFWRVLGEN
jgi:hypothetical protein